METNELTYNQAIKELEHIVAEMQSEQCDIDSLTKMTSRSLELLKYCKEKLLKTDSEVKKCLEEISRI